MALRSVELALVVEGAYTHRTVIFPVVVNLIDRYSQIGRIPS